MRHLFSLCLMFLVACTPRGEMTLVSPQESVGTPETVFVATTRAVDPKTGNFGTKRSEVTTYARYTVAIPPDRETGTITWPRRGSKPDPQHDFLTTSETLYSGEAAFRRDVTATMGRDRRTPREATIFVHGFNTTFSEGLYRIAQLSKDLELPGASIHYSWPSAAIPFGYAYDRDSAIFARSGLESLIREVSGSGAEQVFLVAHSMGCALVVEALHQLAIRGDRKTLSRIGGVILISPDIDVDVFHVQAREIGKLPQPFLIFGSQRDKALRLSARLTGQKSRLGSMANIGAVADLDVTFLDVAAFNVGDGHFNVGDSASLINILGRINEVGAAFEADRASQLGLLPGAVLTVQNATEIILSPVIAVGQRLEQ